MRFGKLTRRVALLGLFVLVFLIIISISSYMMVSYSKTFNCQVAPNLASYYQSNQLGVGRGSYENMPTIYFVTPTYSRYVQKAELTRLSHTLILVPKLHWIIIEDSTVPTDRISKFVAKLKEKFNFRLIQHLAEPTPSEFKLKAGDPSWKYPKGVWQRNRALDWIRTNLGSLDPNGVLYFGDDDNTYDLELFQEMRQTKKISVWPVAFAGGLLVEKPIVSSDNKVQSFNSLWQRKRPFPFDMAGFAISLRLLATKPNATFSAHEQIGFVESSFLKQYVSSWGDLEPMATKCTRILVWHTKTQRPALHEEKKLSEPSYSGTDW